MRSVEPPKEAAAGLRRLASLMVGALALLAASPVSAPAAPQADAGPRATVRFVPERLDDLMWENDRIAFRVYGPALQKVEPPSGSGVDVWVKKVRPPFMARQLASDDYHQDHGEGLDFYDVGGSRGAGGLGVWDDDKLWTSRNFRDYRILDGGPDRASFELDYAPWPVGVDRQVWEHRVVTLPLGSNLNRAVSTIGSDRPGEMIVGIGLNRRGTGDGGGVLTVDPARGLLAYWEPADPRHGSMGTAVLVDPATVVRFAGDADNFLVLVRVEPGRPFVYYHGAAWDRGLDFRTRENWEAWLRDFRPDFDPAH